MKPQDDSKPDATIALRSGDKKNFQTMLKATENGDIALVSAIRRSDGSNVALACAMGREDDGSIMVVPLAVMVEGGNPFNDFIPAGGTTDPERVMNAKPVASQNAQQTALDRAADLIKKEAQDVRHNEDYRLAAATLAQELVGRSHALSVDTSGG
jgi:hypothetical protein